MLLANREVFTPRFKGWITVKVDSTQIELVNVHHIHWFQFILMSCTILDKNGIIMTLKKGQGQILRRKQNNQVIGQVGQNVEGGLREVKVTIPKWSNYTINPVKKVSTTGKRTTDITAQEINHKRLRLSNETAISKMTRHLIYDMNQGDKHSRE